MLTQFWSGLSGKLAERWLALLLSPALLFCVAGLVAWNWKRTEPSISHDGWHAVTQHMGDRMQGLPVIVQGLLVVVPLIGVTLLAMAAQRLSVPLARLLSGHWPHQFDRLYAPLLARRRTRIARDTEKLRHLAGLNLSDRTWQQNRDYAELERRYLLVPAEPGRQLATRLGNTLRAFEDRPRTRYGLSTEVCWPRLWLLLPDTARQEITEARLRLNLALQSVLWGALLVLWTPWAWWALPGGVLVAAGAYIRALGAAASYGEVFASCFDVHRGLLYQALRWPLPQSPAQERESGFALSRYIENGSKAAEPPFVAPLE
ncbi:hypothetical protein BGM19_30245 [Streptomyces agglomeratus]|uniref:hypothetical protein n=1 Tax=Streptomyces agglomeratus TaxID=285458 RepID=UPI00086D3435|nr:hypothetical protein [Streptomyces agglomeratus]OEJ61660.1 hypothetical protein BGM19_30245 [Streptomyces agglomeratus]